MRTGESIRQTTQTSLDKLICLGKCVCQPISGDTAAHYLSSGLITAAAAADWLNPINVCCIHLIFSCLMQLKRLRTSNCSSNGGLCS